AGGEGAGGGAVAGNRARARGARERAAGTARPDSAGGHGPRRRPRRALPEQPLARAGDHGAGRDVPSRVGAVSGGAAGRRRGTQEGSAAEGGADRKSTRLNSSHGSISYAVFCLKKKKQENGINSSCMHVM